MANSNWFQLRGQLGDSTSAARSPDIILGGPAPDPAYAEKYDKVFGQTGNFGGSNYVYVRAKNKGTGLAIADVAVYATYLRYLPNRSMWQQLHTSDGRPNANLAAEDGQVAVSGAPLIWDPETPPAPDAPYCLIARISGDGHPAPQVPDTVTDQESFDAWVATQPTVAYLTVQEPAVVRVPAPNFVWQGHVTLGNNTPVQLGASLTCTAGSPGGSLSYVFSKNDSGGQPIGVGKTLYRLNAAYSQTRTVPIGFDSDITITYIPAADEDAQAQFLFQVTTDKVSSGRGTGIAHPTLVAKYDLSFGQSKGGG
jgi:hypothetical protein